MKFKYSDVALAGMLLCTAAIPLSAHHSVSAEFYLEKRVTLTGVVTQVVWMNPHAWFFVDIKESKTGQVASWAFQLNSPNALANIGWTRNTVKAGDVVTVDGSPSLYGHKVVYARQISFLDGRKQVSASVSLSHAIR